MYYLAYGSNMNHEQMKERCKDSKFLGSAKLEGYKFVYDGYSSGRDGAVGNIIPSESDFVLGGLFEISENDLKSLNGYEGYPDHYQRNDEFEVIFSGKKIKNVIAYFRKGELEGSPSKEYQDVVVKGARDCSLPQDYIQKYLEKV